MAVAAADFLILVCKGGRSKRASRAAVGHERIAPVMPVQASRLKPFGVRFGWRFVQPLPTATTVKQEGL